MDQVEHLLARLLANWDVDLYVRFERPPAVAESVLIAWEGVSDETARVLVASRLVREHAAQAVETGTAVVVSDAQTHEGWTEALAEIGLRAIALLPLDGEEQTQRVALFGSRTSHAFSRSTLDLFHRFGRIVSSYATEKDHSIAQLRRLVIQLTEAENRERGRIATLLHDDLQQTLAGIKVHVDMAANRSEHDPFVTERLATAATLLEQVIERSRTLSHELNPPMLRRRGLVSALRMLASETARTHRLRVDLRDRTGNLALGELASLVTFRAVQELLFNVVKHAGVDEATIIVEAVDEGLRVLVRDHGRGFDVDVVLKRDTPTGLGLVSLRERIEAIGGLLEIESVPGAGSTFTIFLPPAAMAAEGTLAARAAAGAERQSVERRTSILLVDDHAVIRQGLAALLNEEPDLEVVGEADSGETGVEMARRLLPEVVVMDLSMRGIAGDEATRRILAEAPLTRVVGLSMHTEADARDRMIDAGAAAYLPKAGPSADLIAAIRGDD